MVLVLNLAYQNHLENGAVGPAQFYHIMLERLTTLLNAWQAVDPFIQTDMTMLVSQFTKNRHSVIVVTNQTTDSMTYTINQIGAIDAAQVQTQGGNAVVLAMERL